MRVVFMGTPDIAATCLNQILSDGFEVVAVYTQPDRPKGRGNKVIASPVKQVAVEKGIPVWQPETLKDGAIADLLSDLQMPEFSLPDYAHNCAADNPADYLYVYNKFSAAAVRTPAESLLPVALSVPAYLLPEPAVLRIPPLPHTIYRSIPIFSER